MELQNLRSLVEEVCENRRLLIDTMLANKKTSINTLGEYNIAE